jgi:peptide-methionine (R)-S-oxide reductase
MIGFLRWVEFDCIWIGFILRTYDLEWSSPPMNRRIVLVGVFLLTVVTMTIPFWPTAAQEAHTGKRKVQKTDAQWQRQLTRMQYAVTRLKATEPAFTGKYANTHTKGIYECVCCGAELFNSAAKFESGTGWPSFFKPINPKRIDTAIDHEMPGEVRTEVMCMDCGAHLGHVFNDGPEPTGLRFCLNSAALKLVPTSAPTTTKKTTKTAKGKAKTSAKSADSETKAESASENDKPKETAKDQGPEKEKPADPEKPKDDPK